MSFREKHTRSIAKAATYRILIIVANGLVVMLFTKAWDQTIAIMGIGSIASTFIYFLHERLWDGIRWGRVKNNKHEL